MADPTPEELQTQIDELKSLITTQYEPPTGTEYSYPVVNQPMNDEMWAYVTRGIGDGVLDEGGQPYWFRGRENVNNTVRITVSTTTNTAQAILRGFYHKLTADKTFTVPAVSTNTTYYFCLTYDPAASTSPGGPISLQMYAGTPPTTQGRFHVILWELDRKPNQLLTECVYRRVRPKIAPTITVDELAHRPNPSKALWGTQCFVSAKSAWYRATGASDETGGPTGWTSVSDGGFTDPGDTSEYVHAGHGFRRGVRLTPDGYLELRGHISRRNGGNFTVGSHGYQLYDLSGWPSGSNQQFVTAGTGYNPPTAVKIEYSPTDQSVRAYPINRDCSWISLDGVRIYVGDN